jgi:hypothetical protein
VYEGGKSEGHPASVADSLRIFFGALLVGLAALLLFVLLGERPFGIQIATAIIYTAAVFLFVFLRSRLGRGYSLRERTVQQRLPRLLAIHGAFLVLILVIQTAEFALRPHLPGNWFKKASKGVTWFEYVALWIYVLTGMTQVLISRRILSRSLDAEQTTRTPGRE